MISQAGAAKSWRVLLLTCRNQNTDFRRPLADELQVLGHRVTYVFLKRRPTVIDMAEPETERHFSLPGFLAYARREFAGQTPLLVFNSTNLVFPGITRLLRQLCGGLWCFDMHDDLFYDLTGLKRLRAKVAQHMMLAGSDFVVHAPPTLRERFPRAHHLGNASAITAMERPEPDWSRVLILASLDQRFDFPLVARIACASPGLVFDVFGHVSRNDKAVADEMSALTKAVPNIRYHGPYVNDGLPGILGRYAVTLAPYREGSPLTYFIDPLRYYHCLNSGMEVISTDIPKARDFGGVLHILRRPEEFGSLVERLRADPQARRNVGSTAAIHNWRNRAVQLMTIAEAERAKRDRR